MKQIYKNATIGPSVNIQLDVHVLSAVSPVELDIKELTKGWNVVFDEQHYKVRSKWGVFMQFTKMLYIYWFMYTGVQK